MPNTYIIPNFGPLSHCLNGIILLCAHDEGRKDTESCAERRACFLFFSVDADGIGRWRGDFRREEEGLSNGLGHLYSGMVGKNIGIVGERKRGGGAFW